MHKMSIRVQAERCALDPKVKSHRVGRYCNLRANRSRSGSRGRANDDEGAVSNFPNEVTNNSRTDKAFE